WAISNAGALDLAATGLFFFFMQLISMMLKAGLIVVPEKNRKDFGETRGLLKTAWREFQEFQGRSPIWRMALLALGFTVGYMKVGRASCRERGKIAVVCAAEKQRNR